MRDAREQEADRIAEEHLELMPRVVRDKLDASGQSPLGGMAGVGDVGRAAA
jgi:hypothetical protein